jgi:hypothetical protein
MFAFHSFVVMSSCVNSNGIHHIVLLGWFDLSYSELCCLHCHLLHTLTLRLQPVVLFAGEHTHSSFYSTAHAAYLTGRSAAQVLLSSDSPQEHVMECEGTSDLSSWIQGISLD